MSTEPKILRSVTLDLDTGEVIREDDFADYQPHGDCATGCGHPATAVWQLYKGQQRFEFRCGHCVAQGKLMRAEWYASQIPALKAECEKEMAKCATKQETPTPAAPASA